MRKRTVVIKKGIIAIFLMLPFVAVAQQPDSLMKKLDSVNKKTDTTGQVNNINRSNYNENTKITVPVYFTLLVDDIKQQVTAPLRIRGKEWLKVGGFAVLTGALAFADEPLQRSALRLRNRSHAVRTVSRYVTNFGGLYEGYTLAALGAYGYLFKSQKIETTTLLATQAYITAGTIESLLKLVTGRQRPSYYDPDATEAEPTFHGPFYKMGSDINGNKLNSSFPSGHTTVAFAAATVYAMEYRDRPLVPIMSYSAATLIGLSRITENKHWATDVLVGAALGYLCGRQVVNNYHRYAKIQNDKKKKGGLSFQLQYVNGTLLPGVVYHFK